MKKIFHLSSCSTCKRIIHDLQLSKDFLFHDVKANPISETELEFLKNLAGSYEKIFSKIAMKYRLLGLNHKNLTEQDYKSYILNEYTFIKRPIIIMSDNIFVGSSKPVILAAKEMLKTIRN